MKETKTKKCPECSSSDVTDTGSRGPFNKIPKNPVPNAPAVYKCNVCDARFIIN